MKVRVDKYNEMMLSDYDYDHLLYKVRYKKHWWSRWRYIFTPFGEVKYFSEREWQNLVPILSQI